MRAIPFLFRIPISTARFRIVFGEMRSVAFASFLPSLRLPRVTVIWGRGSVEDPIH